MAHGRIPLEELARLPGVFLVTPSWQGDRIAFYSNKTGRNELYVMNLVDRTTVQVTNGGAPRALRTGLVWTRDDRAIIFGKDHDGNEKNNLFRLNLATTEIEQLNDDPKTQEHPGKVAPNNRHMAVMSDRNGQMNVFLLDLETRQWRQLTHFQAPASAGDWSPDGQWLIVAANESQTLKNQDGYLVRADGSEIRRVLHLADGSHDAIAAWHPTGALVAVSSDATGAGKAGLLHLETGETQWLSPDGVEEHPVRFSGDGRWLAVMRDHEATAMPVLYEVATGKERQLLLPPGMSYSPNFVLGDRKLLLVHTAADRRAQVLLYDLAEDTYEVLIPAEYGSIDPGLFVGDQYVRYPSFDGQMVPAILYAPRELAPGEKRPALVMVHGGPTAQYFRMFDPYAQFLVDQGYVLLQPNVRGSTGYGVAWRDANLQDWGGGDLEDVAAGAEYLRTLPYVDPERIGVFGGSYGGYMSFLAVVKKPDHFKVGIPVVGISDLHALYAESMEHFKYYLRHQMGDPETNRELWADRSALTHADKLKARLLIIHGVNDPRCPISQARLFRDRIVALGKQEGVDFEYHEFADEGHGPGGDADQKIRHFRLLADFLERAL